MAERIATITRNTLETQITITLNLDGTGQAKLHSGIAFFDHMLEQIVRHGGIDLDLQASGDLAVDAHHTMEDVGIALGQALHQAVGDKKGIFRYGHAYVPLDEALSRVVMDFSGRPGLFYQVALVQPLINGLDADLFEEFFHGLVNHAGLTLHIDNLCGRNNHHIIETIFKAFGRALRVALQADTRMAGQIPSTKGAL